MVFQHPPGTPTKRWYDSYGVFLQRDVRTRAIVTLGLVGYGLWVWTKWQYNLPYYRPTNNLTAWPYWLERQALIRQGLNPDEHQVVFDVDP